MSDLSSLPVVFLAFANELSERVGYLRHLPEEARALELILTGARQAGLCEIVLRYNATAEDILRVFQSQEYRNRIAIFHYGGHANSYQLLLEDQNGGVLPIRADSIASLLGLQLGLQLVFLNGCSTEQHTEGLLAAGVPAVIATSQIIDDGIARNFAEGFYRGMAGGASIETAFQEAIITVDTEYCNQHRGLKPAPEPEVNTPLPWRIRSREGAENVLNWSLADAAKNPLFGLPALPDIQLPESPFRHLQRFQREHAGVFFGRGYEIRDLYHRISNRQGAPILLVYGQSGVGKSSLLEAGLLPRLERDFKVFYRRRESDQNLWSLLESIITTHPGAPPSASAENWLETEQRIGQALVIIMDQLEEVFTRPNLTNPNEWNNFIDGLNHLFGRGSNRPHGKLILSFRKEWLPEIEGALSKLGLPRNRVFIESLDRKGIIEAIEGPVNNAQLQQYYGLSIENSGLSQTIADDLLSDRDSPVAPVLQILLSKLWEKARQESISRPFFTSQQYQQLKRNGLLLGDFLDQELKLIEQQRPELVRSGLLLDLLVFFTTPQGTTNEHSQIDLANQYGEKLANINELLQNCQYHYLLVDSADEQQGERSWRLGHDALAPLIKMRYEESDRPGQRARRILENRVTDWRGAQAGIVLDEADLAVIETGESGMRKWTPDEHRLVEASRRSRQQRQRRSLGYRVLALAGLLLIISTMGFAMYQWQVAKYKADEAKREQQLALSRQLAAQANLKLKAMPNDVIVGGLLAVEALNKAQTLEAYQAWSDAMSLLPRLSGTATVNPGEEITAMTFSPDGNYLAAIVTAGSKPIGENTSRPNPSDSAKTSWGVVRIWSAQTGQLVKELGAAPRWLNALAYSPDGQTLAAGGADGNIVLWDSQTGNEHLKLQHNASVTALGFQEQGHRLLSLTRDQSGYTEGYWWDVDSGQKIAEMAVGEPGGVEQVETNKDGSLAATFGRDGTVRLWSTSNGKLTQQISVSAKGEKRNISLSENGKYIAWADGDTDSYSQSVKSLVVWDIEKNKLHGRFDHDQKINHYDFSPDGQFLAVCMIEQDEIWLWDLASRSLLEKIKLTPNKFGNPCFNWGFSPDSQLLTYYDINVAEGTPGFVYIWNIKNNQLQAKLEHTVEFGMSPIILEGFSADNRQIYTSCGQLPRNQTEKYKKRGYAWFTQTGQLLKTEESDQVLCLKGPTSKGIFSVFQYRPDESDANENLKICNHVSGQITQEIKQEGKRFDRAIISSDGTLLATTFGPDYSLLIINLTKQSKITVPAKGWINWTRFLNGNQDLLAQNSDGHGSSSAVIIWDVSTGKERFQLSHHLAADKLDFAENQPVTMTKVTGSVDVWDTATKRKLMSVNHGSEVKLFASSPNGMQWLSVADYTDFNNNTFVQIWDIASKRELFRLNHDKAVNQALFSKDGSRIVTASNDQTARLWDSQTGQELARFQHEGAVDYVFITSDNRFLLSKIRDDNNLYLWDVVSGIKMGLIPDYNGDYRNALTHDLKQQRLAVLKEGQIQLWEIQNHGAAQKIIPYQLTADDLQISRDGSQLYGLDNDNGEEPDLVHAHSLKTGKELFSTPPTKHVFKMILAPNQETFATAGSDSILRIWDAHNGQLLKELPHQHPNPGKVSFSPDSEFIATFDSDFTRQNGGLIRLWDTRTGQNKAFINDAFVNSLTFSPDGKILASAEGDLENKFNLNDLEDSVKYLGLMGARIWDLHTGQERFRLSHKSYVSKVLFSPDGKWLVSKDFSIESDINIYDTSNGELFSTLKLDQPSSSAMELQGFSHGGQYLVLTRGQTLYMVDFNNRQVMHKLNFPGSIGQVIFSPNDQLLAIDSYDSKKTVIWSFPEQREIAQFPHASDMVFTPDSRQLITGHDKQVSIWALNRDDFVRDLCSRLVRNFTLDEWRTYKGEQEYQATCSNLPRLDNQ